MVLFGKSPKKQKYKKDAKAKKQDKKQASQDTIKQEDAALFSTSKPDDSTIKSRKVVSPGENMEGSKTGWIKGSEMAPNEQVRYLSQSIVLEESVSPSVVRLTMFAISLIAVVFLVWANIAKVKEVTKTDGVVTTSGYARKVQNLENGIIAEILVENGNVIDQDQILIRLDSTGAQEDLLELQKRQIFLALEAERLRAFSVGKEPDFSKVEKATDSMIEDQKNIYQGMNDAQQTDEKVLKEQIAQKKDDLTIYSNKYQIAMKNYNLAKETYELKKKTFEQGLMSKVELLESEQELVQQRGNVESSKTEVNQAKQAIEEYNNRFNSIGARAKEAVLQQLGRVEDEIARNKETLVKLRNRVERLHIKSPIRGVVKGLAVNTVGGVIIPGQILMEIVPLEEELIVENQISPYDIGHIRVGQNVSVRVDTFDAVRYGTVAGTLQSISATTFLDNTGNSYYKGRVILAHNYVSQDQSKVILPGMTVEADIITGEKTVMQYLLKPVQTAFRGAFSER